MVVMVLFRTTRVESRGSQSGADEISMMKLSEISRYTREGREKKNGGFNEVRKLP